MKIADFRRTFVLFLDCNNLQNLPYHSCSSHPRPAKLTNCKSDCNFCFAKYIVVWAFLGNVFKILFVVNKNCLIYFSIMIKSPSGLMFIFFSKVILSRFGFQQLFPYARSQETWMKRKMLCSLFSLGTNDKCKWSIYNMIANVDQ